MRSSSGAHWRPRGRKQLLELGLAVVLTMALAVLLVIDYRHLHPAAPSAAQTRSSAPRARSYRVGEPAATGKRLLSVKGSGSERTALFTAKEPWSLYWDFECSSMPPKDTFKVSILNADGSAAHLVSLSKNGESGYGNQPYDLTGTFRIHIITDCDWHVIVSYEQ